MGSSSSKPSGSRPASRFCRTKHRLSSLFLCGASSSSYAPLEFEDHPVKSPVTSLENIDPLSDGSRSSIAEASSIFDSEAVNTSDKIETGTSSSSCTGITKDGLHDYDLINIEASNSGRRRLSENGASNSHQPSQELVSTNARVSMDDAADALNSKEESGTIKFSDNEHRSSVECERRNSCSDENQCRDQRGVVVAQNISNMAPHPSASDHLAGHQVQSDENPHPRTSSGAGLPVPESVQDLISEDVLHVDMVSISSNIISNGTPEISNSEARRNSRRLLWNTFSRRNPRRHSDSPSIVFAPGHADELGSHDRWHLNVRGDLHPDGVVHHSSRLGARAHNRNEGRWLGSEISDRILRALGEVDQQTTLCASGRHPHGTCSCESFFTDEEFSTLAGISRIIVLAEALFEVLEELYQQPFSFSPLMPAPEYVVDSFPVKKYHKKLEATGSETGHCDLPQCYICLAEYEEGEKLRILPCHHEYHVSCIDKWLKEINRVCPLCRQNICEDSGQEGSASNAEVSFR